MAYIRIDMTDIDTDELIGELEDRYLNDREKEWLRDILKGLEDEKDKLWQRVKDGFTIIELEEMFKDHTPIVVAKEQLTLPL